MKAVGQSAGPTDDKKLVANEDEQNADVANRRDKRTGCGRHASAVCGSDRETAARETKARNRGEKRRSGVATREARCCCIERVTASHSCPSQAKPSQAKARLIRN